MVFFYTLSLRHYSLFFTLNICSFGAPGTYCNPESPGTLFADPFRGLHLVSVTRKLSQSGLCFPSPS